MTAYPKETLPLWNLSHRFDRAALPIADRHYNRQKPGTPQFVPPGRCLVLFSEPLQSLWVSSWPKYAQHRWRGAWINSLFRKETSIVAASVMIRQAVAATRWKWPEIPALGMVTFIDREKVRPVKVRGVDTWGYTYTLAGFEPDGETEGGLLAFRLPPERMPEPIAPRGKPHLWEAA